MCVSLFTLYYILHYFLFHIGSLFAHGCVLQVSEIANPKINVSLFPSFCLLVDFLLLRYFTMFSPQKKKPFSERGILILYTSETHLPIFLAVIHAPLLTCLPVAPSGGRVVPVADQTVEFEVGIKIIKVLCLTNMQPDHEETLKPPLTSHLYTFHFLEAFGNWDP